MSPVAQTLFPRPDDRVIVLDGIHNFRDYGGYPAAGGHLRTGVLWRSGQHCEATPQDLDAVHALGIETVIDLRGDSEREKYPCKRHGAFEGEVLYHPGDTSGLRGRAVHEETGDAVVTAAQAHDAMVRLYATLPWRPVLAGTYRLYFAALAQKDKPSLLHCLAGKDRTGVAAALLHLLLGVHHDDAMADYLLTNTAGDAERRIEAGAKHLREGYGRNMEEAAIRTFMGVDPAFLDSALGAIRGQHGSVAGYAEEVLGVTPAMRESLAAHLIV